MKHSRNTSQKLTLEDIRENIVIIKINKSFRDGMSETELYGVTRGRWKGKIASAEKADYALAVVYGIVKEVYQTDKWLPAENEMRETIPYNETTDAGRIVFKNRNADRYSGRTFELVIEDGERISLLILLALEILSIHECNA